MTSTKILCMGDSLTEGYGIPDDQSWPTLMGLVLEVDVINCGISGDTTGGMLARFSNALTQHQPSHVIIMGGTNDLWLDLSFNVVLSNTMAMTRQARFFGAMVFVGIPTPCYSSTAGEVPNQIFLTGTHFDEHVKSYQIYLRKAMALDEMQTLDFSVDMTADLFLPDGIHPNRDGNIFMANIAATSILPLI